MPAWEEMGFDRMPSLDELRTAYYRAAAKHHPDVGGSHESMIALNNLYQQGKLEIERGSQPPPPPPPPPRTRSQQSHSETILWWQQYIDRLLDVAEVNEYKPSTVAFWLLECRLMPPIDAWNYAAKQLGYKEGWSHYQFKKWRFDRDKNYPN
jgi:hypothetical protein